VLLTAKVVNALEKTEIKELKIEDKMDNIFNKFLVVGGSINSLELFNLIEDELKANGIKFNKFKECLISQGVKIVSSDKKTVYNGISKKK